MVNDNTGFTEQQLKDYWKAYHGVDLHFFDQLSFNVDGTGHIDMWFLPVNDNTVIVGEWAQEDAYGSKAITDSAAQYMQDSGYTVYRTPNWSSKKKIYGCANQSFNHPVLVFMSNFYCQHLTTFSCSFCSYSTHFTYTNAVIANDIVIISKFNLEPQDTTALDVYQAAFPSKTIVQVDSSRIISRSGALHCIAQHVYDCGLSGPPPTEASL
jgi:agmatine/peptidylarginine deiminase